MDKRKLIIPAMVVGILFLGFASATTIEKGIAVTNFTISNLSENLTINYTTTPTLIPLTPIPNLTNRTVVNYTIITPTPSPTPTPTSVVTPTPTPTPTPIPSPSPTPTVTPTPTPTGKPKLRITHELSAKTGEILLTTYIENIGEGEAKDVKLTMGMPSQIKTENLVGISTVGNTLVWTGELKSGEKHIIKQSIIPLNNEDIEISLTVSYIDPTTGEFITWETIIKVAAWLCCLLCDDKCCEVPMLGIGATVATFGIAYLLVRQRRKL